MPPPQRTPTPAPDPRRAPIIDVGALDLQQAFFEMAVEEQGLRGGDGAVGGGPPTRQTMNEFIRSIPEGEVTRDGVNAREAWIRQFNAWAGANRIAADFDSADLFSQFQADTGGFETGGGVGGGGGGVGRTQFESERALDIARSGLLEQQAQTEAFVRENQRQQAASQAMDRVKGMFDLLQTTDQLADARRQNAVQALISAAPFMVDPSQQFAPGFEPGGVGEVLGGLLGANVPPQILPTAELPLQELANPQLAAPPSAITEALNPMLTAPGQPQIPF